VTLAADGAFLYVPNPGFNGVDWFGYQASDGKELSNFRDVYILVNTTPTATDDAYTTPADTPLVVPAPGVVGNDVDPDGALPTTSLSFGVSNGTLTFSKAGSFTYTPALGFEGVDLFAYQPFDGFVYGGVAYVTITVGSPPEPPFAADDTFTIQQDNPASIPSPGVLANDYDDNGDPMTSAFVTPPAHGKLVMGGGGGFYYAPDLGFTGIDTFTYWAGDGVQFGNVATVTLVVEGPPGATADRDLGSASANCPDSRRPDATTPQDCR
jgi:titin